MKLRSIFAIGISLVAVCATLTGAFAQGIGTPKDDTGKAAKRGATGKKQNPMVAALAAVELTDVQKDSIKEIGKKYRDERKDILESVSPGNNGANKPQSEIRAKLEGLEAKQVTEVKAVLTAEQLLKFQAAYDAAQSGRGSGDLLGGIVEKLALTDEQKTQIMPIVKSTGDAMATLRSDETLGNRDKATKALELWNDAKTKIRPFLNADQQKTLDEMKNLRGAKRERGGGKARPGA